MRKCPSCGTSSLDGSEKCMECGHIYDYGFGFKKNKKKLYIIVGVAVFFAFIVIMVGLSNITNTSNTVSFQSKAQIDSSSAVEIVKNTTSSKGCTLEIFFKNKVSIPAVNDLGWGVNKAYGDFIVKKTIQVGGLRSPTIYKWRVSGNGIVSPLNGHAIGATQ
jgi:hypothetical protein